jgi:hypothetical protein
MPIYLYLGLKEGRTVPIQATLESYSTVQHLKKDLQHLKTTHFFTYFSSVDHFCPPGSGSGYSPPKSMRIQIELLSKANTVVLTIYQCNIKSSALLEFGMFIFVRMHNKSL